MGVSLARDRNYYWSRSSVAASFHNDYIHQVSYNNTSNKLGHKPIPPFRLMWISVLCAIASLTGLSRGISASSSKDYYELYSQLEHALLTGQNNNSCSNLQVIADAFFPKGSSEPICVPIQYAILCNESLEQRGQDEEPMQCIINYSPRFLWTEYALSDNIGTLLLSYFQNGISLKGFEWEKLCLVEDNTEIVLQIATLDYNESLLDDCMEDLTSQVSYCLLSG